MVGGGGGSIVGCRGGGGLGGGRCICMGLGRLRLGVVGMGRRSSRCFEGLSCRGGRVGSVGVVVGGLMCGGGLASRLG